MRRADRLFQIIQILRRKKLVRARDLAEKLEVSERTIYRDIRDLVGSGVPIDGEAGVGYVLRKGYDLPPLMFNERELEALVLGARIIESWTDPEMAESAANVIAKIEAVIPEELRSHMAQTALLAPAEHYAEPLAVDPRMVRPRCATVASWPSSTGTGRSAGPAAASGLWRWPSTDRFGCWSPGASCARTSAVSASTASLRSRSCPRPFARSAASCCRTF